MFVEKNDDFWNKPGFLRRGLWFLGTAWEPVHHYIIRARKHLCIAINPNLQKRANTENIAVQLPNVPLAATSPLTSV